ncbi:septal ring lytic transglycosylase RlpA family protein [Hymenobacter sp. 5317J-9]|uniref:septal ring lytic transglycosylase RlpA family protein n=1 Tax=Hymenobacter sp. 5317J-9 TaxID=2932250 RepID=UPI001FD63D19|nr:septal ring lytic transglycosylase RlpA family protein [Hymenobacter sp. 5317J-9]UOQ97844.1 septal ring lytic transglycosylase RlpA family protein [Hymenobacter sp. 5317J-9]
MTFHSRANPLSTRLLLLLFLALGLLSSCGSSRNAGNDSKGNYSKFSQSGLGSYYANKFNGRATASGSIYRPGQMTAAHNTLPFGTVIRVTNTRNGRSVDVTVTDRGPHTKGYIVDVSRRAAAQLDIIEAGVVPVRVTVVRAASAP